MMTFAIFLVGFFGSVFLGFAAAEAVCVAGFAGVLLVRFADVLLVRFATVLLVRFAAVLTAFFTAFRTTGFFEVFVFDAGSSASGPEDRAAAIASASHDDVTNENDGRKMRAAIVQTNLK